MVESSSPGIVGWLSTNWIAVLALAVSVFTYLSQNRPGEVALGAQRIAVSTLGGPHLLIPISFTNVGSRPVSVTDILVQEKSEDTVATYTTWFSVKADRVENFLHGDWAKHNTPLEDREADFVPFTVVSGESLIKSLVFNLYSGSAVFAPGRSVEYTIFAHTSFGDKSISGTITWPSDLAAALNTGGAKIQVIDQALKWRNTIANASPNPEPGVNP